MKAPCFYLLIAIGLLLASFAETSSGFDVTAEQRRELRAIQNEIRAAETRLRTENFDGCAEALTKVQPRLDRLVQGADAELLELTESHFKRLQILHGQLELEGYVLSPIDVPSADDPMMTEGTISFTEQVAPILTSRCGRCHVNRMQGGLSLVNYSTIIQGPAEGKIVFAGDSIGSRLVEVIEDGSMPPNGQGVTPEELTTLKTWIEEGAKYDGDDATTNLRQLGGATEEPAMATAEVVAETGKETIHFSTDIAPILVENCSGCHINSQNASANLNMTTFRGLIRGGNSGSMIVQGKPAESLLIGKLKGTAGGQRMPQGRPALEAEVIAKIEKWIEEGATYDAGDANLPVPTVAALARARLATHEELSKERLELALSNWELAMPGMEPKYVENDQFVVMGNFDDDKLNEVLTAAEDVVPTIGRILKVRSRGPIVKGRISLFLVPQRYDYSEFGNMIEQRQLPDMWRGHWRYTTIDAYGVTILPKDEEEFSLEAMLAQQIAGNLMASLAPDVPIWFSEGFSRVVASRVARDDARVLEWQDQLATVSAKMQNPADFVTGRIGGEDRFIVSFKFVEFLMSDSQRFTRLVNGLKSGSGFAASLQGAYGGNANELARAWAR